MREKRVVWVGSAHDDLRAFPEKARRRAGYELHQVQKTGRTRKRDIDLARSRLGTVLANRGEADG